MQCNATQRNAHSLATYLIKAAWPSMVWNRTDRERERGREQWWFIYSLYYIILLLSFDISWTDLPSIDPTQWEKEVYDGAVRLGRVKRSYLSGLGINIRTRGGGKNLFSIQTTCNRYDIIGRSSVFERRFFLHDGKKNTVPSLGCWCSRFFSLDWCRCRLFESSPLPPDWGRCRKILGFFFFPRSMNERDEMGWGTLL